MLQILHAHPVCALAIVLPGLFHLCAFDGDYKS